MDKHISLRRFYFKPEEGRKVINPETNTIVPPEGALVLNNKYFRRRIKEGDGHEADMPKEQPAAKGKNKDQKED